MKKLLISGLVALTLSNDGLRAQEQNFMLQVHREGLNLFQEDGSVSLAATARALDEAINGRDFTEVRSLISILDLLISDKQIEQIKTDYVTKKGWFKNVQEPVVNYMIQQGRCSFVNNDVQDIGVVLTNLGFNVYSLNTADQKEFLECYLVNIADLIENLSELDELSIIKKAFLPSNLQMDCIALFHHQAKQNFDDIALNVVEIPLDQAKQIISVAAKEALDIRLKAVYAANKSIQNKANLVAAVSATSLIGAVLYKMKYLNN